MLCDSTHRLLSPSITFSGFKIYQSDDQGVQKKSDETDIMGFLNNASEKGGTLCVLVGPCTLFSLCSFTARTDITAVLARVPNLYFVQLLCFPTTFSRSIACVSLSRGRVRTEVQRRVGFRVQQVKFEEQNDGLYAGFGAFSRVTASSTTLLARGETISSSSSGFFY